MKPFIAIAIVFVLLGGCEEDDEPALASPGAFKMTMDGEEMQSEKATTFYERRPDNFAAFGTSFITANDTTLLSFYFMISAMIEGKFEIYGREDLMKAVQPQIIVDKLVEPGPEYFNMITPGDKLGEITITKFDQVNMLMSGTFEVKLSNLYKYSTKNVITITNGSFTDLSISH
jgi:hypothetical protein